MALPPSPMVVDNQLTTVSTTTLHSCVPAPTCQASSTSTDSESCDTPSAISTDRTNSSTLPHSTYEMSNAPACSLLISATEIHTQSDDSAIIPLSTEMSALSLSLPTAHVLTKPTNSNSVSVATEPDATLSVKVSIHSYNNDHIIIIITIMQISVLSASDSSTVTYVLPNSLCQVGEALGKGNMPSIAKAILDNEQLADHVLQLVIKSIDSECSVLCQRNPQSCSLFRKISVVEMRNFKWNCLIDELSSKAPTLYRILYSLVSHSDHRNKKKVAEAHFPGICMTCAVLLKERNREMCGVQSMISFLLYYSRAEKQVLHLK